MRELTARLKEGREMDAASIADLVAVLLDESIAAEDKADLLAALRSKGETPAEIAGLAKGLLAHAINPGIQAKDYAGPLLDVCGTGGDHLGLFNISTSVMLVAAACGAMVVKHGNRSVTSRSGGADVLEELGVPINLPPERAGEALASCGAVFLFAPAYHPAFKAVVPARKLLAERGQSSVFNLLGPLLNPARPDYQMSGIYSRDLLEAYAELFRLLGRRGGWAVHGDAGSGKGMDEVSLCGPTAVAALTDDTILAYTIDPVALGLRQAPIECLQCDSAAASAAIIHNILRGDAASEQTDIVRLNTAAALTMCGLAEEIGHGLELAAQALQDGQALKVLKKMQSFS